MVFHALVQLTQGLLAILHTLEKQLLLDSDLALELFQLEISIVVDVVDLSQLFLECLKLLVEVVYFRRVGLGQLLELALQVVVDLRFECVQLTLIEVSLAQLLIQLGHDLVLNLVACCVQSGSKRLELLGVHLLVLLELGPEEGELHFEVLRGDGLCDAALHANVLSL